MRITYLAVTVAAASLASAGVIRRDDPQYENAVYWGQNDGERGLAEYCADDTYDIVILSFLNMFGDGQYPNGQIGNDCVIDSDGNGNGCDGLINDINTCRSAGKKIIMSVGGAAAYWDLSSKGDAEGVAYSLWNSYANPDVVDSKSQRPLGDTFIDGWDFDIEQDNGASEYLADLVNALRGNFDSDTDNSYYITGAPQCPLNPIADMDDAIKNSQFDYLFIQFYNNNCAAADVVKDSSGNPNGAGDFNFGDWPGYLSGGASEGAKLFVGIPAASTSAESYDYINSGDLPKVLDASKGVAGFSGFMLYDAGDSDHTLSDGCNYGQEVRSVLNTGATGTC